jgi:ubiquinone/menaquinone biosynthesis C-methylase UbiE
MRDSLSAFDQVADRYDAEFTETPLGRALRQIVWSRLAEQGRPGMRVLEIGCGTGEDAVWLARQGIHVVATDVAPAMLAVTREKALRAGVAGKVETLVLDAASPTSQSLLVDAAFSNFGALNCVNDLRPIARALAGWLKPGGRLVLVFINRWCAWEIAWHLIHLQPRVAFRRLRHDGVEARVGAGRVRTWYPSIGSIRRTFAPEFELTRRMGLGVFLPPSYLEPVVAKRPGLFHRLSRLERATASRFPWSHLADHIIAEFQRV